MFTHLEWMCPRKRLKEPRSRILKFNNSWNSKNNVPFSATSDPGYLGRFRPNETALSCAPSVVGAVEAQSIGDGCVGIVQPRASRSKALLSRLVSVCPQGCELLSGILRAAEDTTMCSNHIAMLNCSELQLMNRRHNITVSQACKTFAGTCCITLITKMRETWKGARWLLETPLDAR